MLPDKHHLISFYLPKKQRNVSLILITHYKNVPSKGLPIYTIYNNIYEYNRPPSVTVYEVLVPAHINSRLLESDPVLPVFFFVPSFHFPIRLNERDEIGAAGRDFPLTP